MKALETPLSILATTIAPVMPFVMQVAAQTGADVSFSVTEVALITVLLGSMVTSLVFVHKSLIASKDAQIKALGEQVAATVTSAAKDQRALDSLAALLESNRQAVSTVASGLEAVRTRIHEWGNVQTPVFLKLELHMEQNNRLVQAMLDTLAQDKRQEGK